MAQALFDGHEYAWAWACPRCAHSNKNARVTLHAVREEEGEVFYLAICVECGHILECEYCAREHHPGSSEFQIAYDHPMHDTASCVAGKHYVKHLPKSDSSSRREKLFVLSEAQQQNIYERDRACRFRNFDVLAIGKNLGGKVGSPILLSDREIQRIVSKRSRHIQRAPVLSLFDLPETSPAELDLSDVFFDLRDLYAEAAARQGQRMQQYDHLLPVKYIRPIAALFESDEQRFLGQECVVLSCNLCNRRRRARLEDEPRLLEIYIRVFLGGFRKIPDEEYHKFEIFSRAVRQAHEHRTAQTLVRGA